MHRRIGFPAVLAAALLAACGGGARVVNGGVHVVGFSDSSSPGEPVPGRFPDEIAAGGDWPDGVLGVLWTDGAPAALGCDGAYAHPASVSVSDGGDVYVAGEDVECEEPGLFTYFATLWKNGGRVGLGGAQSHATSVAADGDDAYVAGYQRCYAPLDYDGGQYWGRCTVAKLWKNGRETDLSDTAAYHHEEAHSVCVSGGDVYVAGFQEDDDYSRPRAVHAKLWKNGAGAILDDGENETYAVSVHVRGDDVYVAGYEKIFENEMCYTTKAVLWKNGERAHLGGGHGSEATSVFVSDEGDVYVAGRLMGDDRFVRAVIWKNGEPGVLAFPTQTIGVYSVFVSDGIVYAAGSAMVHDPDPPFVRPAALLWRDGAAEVLDAGGAARAGASSVFVKK
jgi:hypothetical protein